MRSNNKEAGPHEGERPTTEDRRSSFVAGMEDPGEGEGAATTEMVVALTTVKVAMEANNPTTAEGHPRATATNPKGQVTREGHPRGMATGRGKMALTVAAVVEGVMGEADLTTLSNGSSRVV